MTCQWRADQLFAEVEAAIFHVRAIARRRKAWFRLRMSMSRKLFAAKHCWTTLRMSRPLFVGSHLVGFRPMNRKNDKQGCFAQFERLLSCIKTRPFNLIQSMSVLDIFFPVTYAVE